jgi:hypothetical protein
MPPEPDEKSFYERLLDALGSPTNHYHTVAQLRRIARDLLQFVKARTLIIDELHSMLAGTHRQQQILLNTLRFLANDIKLPLICAGTGNAKYLFITLIVPSFTFPGGSTACLNPIRVQISCLTTFPTLKTLGIARL